MRKICNNSLSLKKPPYYEENRIKNKINAESNTLLEEGSTKKKMDFLNKKVIAKVEKKENLFLVTHSTNMSEIKFNKVKVIDSSAKGTENQGVAAIFDPHKRTGQALLGCVWPDDWEKIHRLTSFSSMEMTLSEGSDDEGGDFIGNGDSDGEGGGQDGSPITTGE